LAAMAACRHLAALLVGLWVSDAARRGETSRQSSAAAVQHSAAKRVATTAAAESTTPLTITERVAQALVKPAVNVALKSRFPGAPVVTEVQHRGIKHAKAAVRIHMPKDMPDKVQVEACKRSLAQYFTDLAGETRQPTEYAEIARNVADFAPEAFARFTGRGAARDYWIKSIEYRVRSKAMEASMIAVSDEGDDIEHEVHEAALDTLLSLVKPLEKLVAEESISMSHLHVQESCWPEASPIDEESWQQLWTSVTAVEWNRETVPHEWLVAKKLRAEVENDQKGRPFNGTAWQMYVSDAVKAMPGRQR